MRLIDADVIRLPKGFFEKVDNVPKFYEWLSEQPTIDAVEVVRCKDCKWYVIVQLKKDGTDDRRYNPSYCMMWDNYFKSDFFCADGERREDETDCAYGKENGCIKCTKWMYGKWSGCKKFDNIKKFGNQRDMKERKDETD